MNEYGLTIDNILSSLPPVLANDENIYALATAAATALVEHDNGIDGISIYPNIDKASEDLCDILAQDFDVTWYDYDYALEKKRSIIKSNFTVHRQLGSTGAVSDLVAAAFKDGTVEEWFDYGGEPYHFKIKLSEDSDFQMTENTVELFSKLIENVKSLRSHLDNIEVHKKLSNTVYLGAIVAPQNHTEMNNDITMDSESYTSPKTLLASIVELFGIDEGTKGRSINEDLQTNTARVGTILANCAVQTLEV